MKQSAAEIPNPTPDFATALEALKNFLGKIEKKAQTVCLHDSDADGVTAGVVWQKAMERLGFENPVRVLPTRERNAWLGETGKLVRAAKPDFLFVLDLGSQPADIVENAPNCFIDHHRPGGALAKDTLISAYNWSPVPNTSLIVYDLFANLTDVSDLDWIAAIGVFSDLGDKAPFPLLEETKQKYTAKYLRDATSLINASRRAAHYEPEISAQALLKHENPKDLVNSESEEVKRLREMKAEVNAEMQEARKAAPKFAGNVALVRINSPCQIHPLIAQSWRSRLDKKYIVICANEGFMPGKINFSARSHENISALDFLRSIKIDAREGSYAQGHDQATGGSLPVAAWNELLAKLGFSEEFFVQNQS